MNPTKACSQCHTEKPRTEFYVRRASPDGLEARCRECAKRIENGKRQLRLATAVERTPADRKRCAKCRETKDRSAFGPSKINSDALYSYCYACRRTSNRVSYKVNRDVIRERARWAALKYSRGITKAEYEQMLAAQRGVCAICAKPNARHHQGGTLRRLAVDHDAKTGRNRGLLCDPCNQGLGMFLDNPVLLVNAISYLAKSVVAEICDLNLSERP